MIYNKVVKQCLIGLAGMLLIHPIMAGPSPEARALIKKLGLQSTDQPLSSNPAWHPKRVVVSLPVRSSSALPQLEQQLRTAAGDIELIIDRSEDLSLGREILAGADAIISRCTPVTIKNADKSLLWLHHYSAGIEGCVGLSEDQIEKTVFSNSKRLYGPTIAEHTIAMLLSLTNGLPTFGRAQAEGQWQRSLAGPNRLGNIDGKTMLVVGLGGIGTQIAWRAHGLGMRVIATRYSSREGPDYVDYVGVSEELPVLVGQADVIVNALPLTATTKGLFDKKIFDSAKTGAIFLSVGRGKSTVTEDLIAALESGQLSAAGLDVTDPEPLPENSPLWQMSNVIITPHISATGIGSLRNSFILVVENLRRYVAGEALLNVVDIRAGY
jgi:phosphoglycerate dehydrogenase-like enzyme